MKVQFSQRFTKYYLSKTMDSKMWDYEHPKYFIVFDILPSVTFIKKDDTDVERRNLRKSKTGKEQKKASFTTLTISFLVWSITVKF